MVNSRLKEQLESHHSDAGAHIVSGDGQCPVDNDDDQQMLNLQKELNEAHTQIKKIVCTRLYANVL